MIISILIKHPAFGSENIAWHFIYDGIIKKVAIAKLLTIKTITLGAHDNLSRS